MLASLNGIDVYYETSGEGRPLVFIHGLGYDSSMWELQKEFSGRFRMVTYDLRGHGRSTRTHERYSIDLFVEDLRALCTHLSMERAHILGVSMGGCIALKYALLFPHAVSSLTLVNTFARVGVHSLRDAYKVILRRYLLSLFSMDTLARMSADRLFERGSRLHTLAYAKFLENDRRCYLEASRAAFSFDCLDSLKDISAPTLIISGRGDRVVSSHHARRLAGGIANSRLVLLEGGHALPVESADALNYALWDFLTNQL